MLKWTTHWGCDQEQSGNVGKQEEKYQSLHFLISPVSKESSGWCKINHGCPNTISAVEFSRTSREISSLMKNSYAQLNRSSLVPDVSVIQGHSSYRLGLVVSFNRGSSVSWVGGIGSLRWISRLTQSQWVRWLNRKHQWQKWLFWQSKERSWHRLHEQNSPKGVEDGWGIQGWHAQMHRNRHNPWVSRFLHSARDHVDSICIGSGSGVAYVTINDCLFSFVASPWQHLNEVQIICYY